MTPDPLAEVRERLGELIKPLSTGESLSPEEYSRLIGVYNDLATLRAEFDAAFADNAMLAIETESLRAEVERLRAVGEANNDLISSLGADLMTANAENTRLTARLAVVEGALRAVVAQVYLDAPAGTHGQHVTHDMAVALERASVAFGEFGSEKTPPSQEAKGDRT